MPASPIDLLARLVRSGGAQAQPERGALPQRLSWVDRRSREDHPFLLDDDACCFLGEYTPGRGYAFSPTNDLLLNFKKPVRRRRRREWSHKLQAIQAAAEAFRTALDSAMLESVTFVPIPPSRTRNHPLHDDRLTQMLRAIRPDPALDVRELIVQATDMPAAHSVRFRPGPEFIAAHYHLDECLASPAPSAIAIVDDLLTTGAHYRAGQSVLTARFPGVPVLGLFIARRVPDRAARSRTAAADSAHPPIATSKRDGCRVEEDHRRTRA